MIFITGFQFKYPELKMALSAICGDFADGNHEFYAEHLNFHVLKKSTSEIQKGTLIDYQLKLYGVPINWRTLIDEWNPNRSFVDTQLSGPYQKWHHTHYFEPLAGGTFIRDRILYKVPLGGMGDLVGGWKVAADIEKIFAFRQEKIRSLF